MSIHAMYHAYCDTPGCVFNNERGTDDEFTTKAALLQHLRDAGWRVSPKKQYCHLCVNESTAREEQPTDG